MMYVHNQPTITVPFCLKYWIWNGVYKISIILLNLESIVNVIVCENQSYKFVLVRLKEHYCFFYWVIVYELKIWSRF